MQHLKSSHGTPNQLIKKWFWDYRNRYRYRARYRFRFRRNEISTSSGSLPLNAIWNFETAFTQLIKNVVRIIAIGIAIGIQIEIGCAIEKN